MQGQGTYYWNNGNKYVGDWYEGKRHGQGTMYYSADDSYNRKYYDGDWYEGKRHGQGTLVWNDGDKYVGGYKNDEWHGQGTYYYSDGRSEKRYYIDGEKQ